MAGDESPSWHSTISEGSIDRIPIRLWVMHGAVMFGREFCYAMETALVTPVLLQIGLPEQYYSLTWFLSPILGLIFTPLIGSASDRCTLSWGRRRPFILALSIGVLFGVALFLNGSVIGLAIGDVPDKQPIGIVLTVLGVVVLDFCADATEGPIRAYLLDVVDSEEQDMALNIHAFSAGAIGYMLGGLDWTQTFLGVIFKSQEQVLFFFAAIIFSVSVALHLFSIEEEQYNPQQDRMDDEGDTLSSVKFSGTETPRARKGKPKPTVRLLWLSMLKMPKELLRLCVCHLLTWFSIIAEAVFYTDFMGQVIFQGDPKAPSNSTELHAYNAGVQMGCWGLVIYAATAAVCSGKRLHSQTLERDLHPGHTGFFSGHCSDGDVPNVYVTMIMISTMGIVSMSISYCPYALLGQYHDIKEVRGYIHHSPGNSKRGFGIDCAILSCQVYISQILVASALGGVVDVVGTVRVIPMVASVGSFLGFLTATFLVIYPEVNEEPKEEQKGLGPPETTEGSSTSAEKPTVLKLTRKGTAASELEGESAV
uniref:Solute carrier family 45 member 4 n=1 Tax=Anas platyrhynchos TaxID=8839 RepID=A0A8B9QSV1_ANAPL